MRIVHLTDLHLRHNLPGTSSIPKRRSRVVLGLLERAVTRLPDLQPDLVAVTGDLLDYPLEYRADPRFRSLARKDLIAMRQLLDQAACPVIVLPGNHDLEDLCRQVFAPDPECAIAGHRVLTFQDRQGQGYVPYRVGRERERFAAALEDDDPRPQVHLQHYVVWPRLNGNYPYSYADAEALQERITRSGRVRLVLQGHYHRGVEPLAVGDTWFAVTPALCEAPYRYWVYELADSGLTCHEEILEG
jgi:3',5'-cyclic-AMP phosphodiesterase